MTQKEEQEALDLQGVTDPWRYMIDYLSRAAEKDIETSVYMSLMTDKEMYSTRYTDLARKNITDAMKKSIEDFRDSLEKGN